MVIEGLQDKAEEADTVEVSVEKESDSSSGTCKRMRLDSIDDAGRKNVGAEVAVDEGIDSPSSPLHVRSDEDIQ